LGLRKEHVKEEFLRGSGRGGQAVNKTANKVRVTHLPTGVQAVSQQERERSKNRFIALRSLVAKLEAPGQIKDEGEKRRGQIRKLKAKVTTFPVPRESLSPSLPFSLPFFLSLSLSLSLSLPLPLSRSRFFSRARAFLLRAALCSLCLPGEASELEEEEEEGGDTCNTVLGDASCRRGDGTGIIAMGEANFPQWPS